MTREMAGHLTRQWLQQFLGGIVLAIFAWAFLNTPDQKGWNVALSSLLAILCLFSVTWLVASNLTGQFRPRLTRLPAIALALLVFFSVLWFSGYAENAGWYAKASTSIASALTLWIKKPISPDRVTNWIEWLLLVVRWIILPLLFIPLLTRLSGARPIRFVRFALFYLVAFFIGAVAPHYLIHWVIHFGPKLVGLWPELLSVAIRFLLAYLLLITAWVLLGRSCRVESPS